MSISIGVVHVHDPETGWSTLPVAAVGWTQDWDFWDWVPRCEAARQLRYDMIEEFTETQRRQWIQERCADPAAAYSVIEVTRVIADEPGPAAEKAVKDLLDELLLAQR